MRLSHKKEFLRFASSDALFRVVYKFAKKIGKLQSFKMKGMWACVRVCVRTSPQYRFVDISAHSFLRVKV